MTSIVQVNVSQTIAPTPNKLQKTGAIISQGATNTSPGTKSLITQGSDLTPILLGALTLSVLTWSGGVVTATAVSPHGYTIGDELWLTISGATPTGYNGTYFCTVTTSSAVTYVVAATLSSPASVPGSYTDADVAELSSQINTFFSQGSGQAVYVLELGAGDEQDGVAFLTAWITANPLVFYSYLVPREWDSNSYFLAFLAGFNNTTSKTYFFVTTTLATWQNYTNLLKCVVAMIECPSYSAWAANILTAITYNGGYVTATTTTNHGVGVGQYFTINGVTPIGYNGTYKALAGTTGNTLVYAVSSVLGAESVLGTLVASYYTSAGIPPNEFSHAADFQVSLNYNPSTTNKVTPFQFSFLFGVTPFPTQGNSSILQQLKNAAVNVVGTGAEGGISDTILLWGTTMDANQFTYWYSCDWVQINLDLDTSNAVINGSNNPINPLYNNQQSINVLQGVGAATLSRGISYGLVLGSVIQTNYTGPQLVDAIDADQFGGFANINAIPFIPYNKENLGDYKLGKYAGLTVIYTPQLGFESIIYNVNITTFV